MPLRLLAPNALSCAATSDTSELLAAQGAQERARTVMLHHGRHISTRGRERLCQTVHGTDWVKAACASLAVESRRLRPEVSKCVRSSLLHARAKSWLGVSLRSGVFILVLIFFFLTVGRLASGVIDGEMLAPGRRLRLCLFFL